MGRRIVYTTLSSLDEWGDKNMLHKSSVASSAHVSGLYQVFTTANLAKILTALFFDHLITLVDILCHQFSHEVGVSSQLQEH